MESSQGNSCSAVQYYKGSDINAEVINSTSLESQNSVKNELKEDLSQNSENKQLDSVSEQKTNHNKTEDETSVEINIKNKCTKNALESKTKSSFDTEKANNSNSNSNGEKPTSEMGFQIEINSGNLKTDITNDVSMKEIEAVEKEDEKEKPESVKKVNEESIENDSHFARKGKKRKFSESYAENDSINESCDSGDEEESNSDLDGEEGTGYKPRRRGRNKKNPDIIPTHLSSDVVLGYKILLKFLEMSQFSGFHKPFKKSGEEEDCKITCLNQIKKKFEENSYTKVCEFVNDVREMLVNIYESRNSVAIKKALKLEQILEQRIAQLPNYLRPQCALVLSSEEINNSHNKIRISKGGGFVSLLLEKTEKQRYEKNREKRKLLAEERKQLKEEQDKDVQDWEKNVLLKDFEEEIKSMWELPAIGHFIHLCADVLNIGEVSQFEVERMLLMPQCSDTLDLIMTALLTNSLVRAKLDRTPSMPYSIWSPLVRTRVVSWYRMWHKEDRNEQKLFEEIGIEPDFWQILGPEINPLDYYYFHELSLLQRVWILKTLCDVDFIRKKTVNDNIRGQTLDELNPVHLGLDQQGNRYIQFKQFSNTDIRIYRQSTKLDGDLSPSDLIESIEGFEYREGPITIDKVFRDIWDVNDKVEVKTKNKKIKKTKKIKKKSPPRGRIPEEAAPERKNLRRSLRTTQKVYRDYSDSESSDSDLITVRNKSVKQDTLYRPFSDKEFISLNIFRLPRDKVIKTTLKKNSCTGKKLEDPNRNEAGGDKGVKTEKEDKNVEVKSSVCEDEQTNSSDVKSLQENHMELQKIFQGDDMYGDEFDLGEKINNVKLDKVNNDVDFDINNLDNLKMGFSNIEDKSCEKNSLNPNGIATVKTEENYSERDKEYDSLYKYNVPDHLKPDSSKFYLVVDSVEGLRQLISKFGSHENDLEIISRSTKSKRKSDNVAGTSSEIQLIEKLQNLLEELEPWEFDLIKSNRISKEKMYKEYMSFVNRPPDFVHPNESYWMKTYEEPKSTTTTTTTTTTISTSTASTTANTTTTSITITTNTTSSMPNNTSNGKEGVNSANESPETGLNQQENSLDSLLPRKRTRVTRVQLLPDYKDSDDDFDDDDYESSESDDNWVLPTPKRRSKKEQPAKISKTPKRCSARKVKTTPVSKNDTQPTTAEKSNTSSPEKTKKALFWGPRSSDPSEDLNWEKNRQKILEQHNSPIKKVLFKGDEVIGNVKDMDKTAKHKPDTPMSVITSSSKRIPPQIPGNKKPYYSSAQLKAMENQKKESTGIHNLETSEVKKIGIGSNADSFMVNTANKGTLQMQTLGQIKPTASNKVIISPQSLTVAGQQSSKPVTLTVANTADTSKSNSKELVKLAQDLNKQMQSSLSPIKTINQKFQTIEIAAEKLAQIQVQPPSSRGQQSLSPIIQPTRIKAVATSLGNVTQHQSLQVQPKVMTLQTVGSPGKMVQQVQNQPQVQIQNHPQVQLLNQTQVQSQIQPIIRLEALKGSDINLLEEKPGVGTRIALSSNSSISEDLYITDGKQLMKFDNNFFEQYLQKDRATTLQEKLDLKKPLLIVKPKKTGTPNANQSQVELPENQQNILVFSKPTEPQQSVTTTSVSSFVVSGNYIIKDHSQPQAQGQQQTVKVVQQAPTYVIQQKPVANKSSQPQIIKIITSQPLSSTQNFIINAADINQLIQPITSTVVGACQQQVKSPPTLRFVRPQNSTVQNKINPVQGQIIINSMVQIPEKGLKTYKPQASVGRIVSSAVPTIQVNSQNIVPSTQINQAIGLAANINAQNIKIESKDQSQQIQTQSDLTSSSSHVLRTTGTSTSNTQTVRLISTSQPQQVQSQNIIVSSNTNPQFLTPLTNINQQTLRIVTNSQPQVQNRVVMSPASLNSQCVWTTTEVNDQQINNNQTRAVISSANFSPQLFGTSQPVRFVTNAQQQVQSQTVLVSADTLQQVLGSAPHSVKTNTQQIPTQIIAPSGSPTKSGQSVKIVSGVSPQPVKFVANNNVGIKFINKNSPPVKGTIVANTAQPQTVTVSNIRPCGTAGQAVRLQTVMPTGMKAPQKSSMATPLTTSTISSNTTIQTPVIIKIKSEENVKPVEERLTEPPITMDYLHGELSVKKTSQGWKYAVKASNGKDVILTDKQIGERVKANNGVMK